MDSLICDLHFNLAKHWLIDINGLSGLEIDFIQKHKRFFLCVDFFYDWDTFVITGRWEYLQW